MFFLSWRRCRLLQFSAMREDAKAFAVGHYGFGVFSSNAGSRCSGYVASQSHKLFFCLW
jgi:hypothetical protein